MVEDSTGGAASSDAVPAQVAIDRTPPWSLVVGAVFATLTLIYLFAYGILSGFYPQFVCNSFTPLAASFALGCGLAASFMGGAAAVTGHLGLGAQRNSVAFSVGGGIAVLVIAFLIFWQFPPKACTIHQITISDMFFLDETLTTGKPSDRSLKFTNLKKNSTIDSPFNITDLNELFIPFVAIISNYAPDQSGQIGVKAKVDVLMPPDENGVEVVRDSYNFEFKTDSDWESQFLVGRSGGPKSVLTQLEQNHINIAPFSFPIFRAASCLGGLPWGTKYLTIKLTVSDSVSSAASTLEAALNWPAERIAGVIQCHGQ